LSCPISWRRIRRQAVVGNAWDAHIYGLCWHFVRQFPPGRQSERWNDCWRPRLNTKVSPMASDTPLHGKTPEQKKVEEHLTRVKEIRELHARGSISEAEMTNMLLSIRLEKCQELRTRGIISEAEMTNTLIEDLLCSE
jgi:hypothetical protein